VNQQGLLAMTRISLAAFAVVLSWACAVPVRADVIYNNGMVNTLSTALGDNALVQDGATNPTTLAIAPGGSVKNATVQGSSYLNLLPGSFALLPTGGIVTGNVILQDNSTLNVSDRGAAVSGTLSAYGNSKATIGSAFNGAYFTVGGVSAHDFSTVQISGPTGAILSDGNSTLTTEGADAARLTAAGHSTVIVNGLTLHSGRLTTTDDAHLIVNEVYG
jgi:hypothetical protein